MKIVKDRLHRADWSFTSESEIARALRVSGKGTRGATRIYGSRAFYAFPHTCISRGHVSTNIPRKPGGMKSFAPFWPSRRRDERFVELTRKIFPSYRDTPAMKNIERYSLAGQVVAPRKITLPIVDFSFAGFTSFSTRMLDSINI